MINEVVGEAEVLLGDLELSHHLCVLQLAEQRIERLAGLEVNRAVLYLDEDIVGELAVKRLELLDSLVCAVRAGRTVNEGPPHNDAAVRGKGFGEHIRSVSVAATIVLRAFLAFGVGLDKEAAEVRDEAVDFSGLVFPPLAELRVERVALFDSIKHQRAGPLDGNVAAYAVFAQDGGNLCDALKMFAVEHDRVRVYIVEHGSVDAH